MEKDECNLLFCTKKNYLCYVFQPYERIENETFGQVLKSSSTPGLQG